MEEKKISIKYYVYCVVCLFLFLVSVLACIAWIMPACSEKIDNYFNPKQESGDERFTAEYQEPGIGVYHDNELNVTCYLTGVGLSCIPDAEIGRSQKMEERKEC